MVCVCMGGGIGWIQVENPWKFFFYKIKNVIVDSETMQKTAFLFIIEPDAGKT